MLKMEEFSGKFYLTNRRDQIFKNEYVRFTWDTGCLEMRKDKWEKLSQKKKNLILKMAKK